MTHVDPELAPVLAAAARNVVKYPPPPAGDVLALRAYTEGSLSALLSSYSSAAAVEVVECAVEALDGTPLPVRRYRRAGSASGTAVVYFHGGGMVCGSVADYDPLLRWYADRSGADIIAVDYRLAPEFPAPTAAHDGLAALRYTIRNAPELGLDPRRVAVMGDSGGACVAAAVAIQARDESLPLAAQILVYPMLDDRESPSPRQDTPVVWTYENNRTAWAAVLRGAPADVAPSPLAVPARATDLTGVAPAYIEVGDLDIFCEEAVDHALRLQRASVPCELHVHPGVPHAFDLLAPDADVTRRALADRLRRVRAL